MRYDEGIGNGKAGKAARKPEENASTGESVSGWQPVGNDLIKRLIKCLPCVIGRILLNV